MRRPLILAALVMAALPLAPASAEPPRCDAYSDRPCFLICETFADVFRAVAMLVDGVETC